MLFICYQIKMNKNNMTLKQNLLILIATLLFSIISASMDFVHTAVLATNMPPTVITSTANTAPLAHETFLPTRDPVSVTQNPT